MARRIDHASWDQLFVRTAASGRPLQARLREMVTSAISEGWLATDMPLPSSRQLARNLKIARNTVLLAYQQLVDEDVLEARERSGYFVKSASSACPSAERSNKENAGAAVDWTGRLAIRPAEQHNIVKPADWLNIPYPFIYGQADPTLFPINDWRECVRQALSVLEIRGWSADLVDGDDPELVEQIRTRVLPRRGIWATPDEIMITLGAQQALYLLAELLIRPDLVVGMEEPGYPDARNIFALKSAALRMLPVDCDGIDPDDVPRDCRLLFLTPSRHCPTGVRLSKDRRERLLAIADTRDLLIIEDDFESNFGLSRDASIAMRGLDASSRVLYVGSLSKTLAPGLRVGYIVGPPEVMREARALRRLMLRHAPTNNQRALALFLALGHFDRLLRKTVSALEERATIMRMALTRHLPAFDASYGVGGSSVWVKGPDGLDSRALAVRARDAGVLIEPGDVFFEGEGPPKQYFRLGFAAIPATRIEPGLEILGGIAAGKLEP
ncbi:MAG: PLP-dependent aminotransferase family protein [Geminicoccaceae bacterium]